MEREEVASVKTPQTVFRADPDIAVAVLINVVDLGIGKAVIGSIKPGQLRFCDIRQEEQGYENDKNPQKMFQNGKF